MRDFNAKATPEDIFKPTIAKESLHKISNINIRLMNFATSKHLIVKSIKFPHSNVHKPGPLFSFPQWRLVAHLIGWAHQ